MLSFSSIFLSLAIKSCFFFFFLLVLLAVSNQTGKMAVWGEKKIHITAQQPEENNKCRALYKL